MDDEQIDVQLQEYAARWRANEPPAAARVARPRRRPVLLPALTAAAVAATVVGVTLAQRDTAAPPVAGPTPTPTATAAQTACVWDPDAPTLRWSVGFSLAPDHHVTGNLVGELRVTNVGPTVCTIPDESYVTLFRGHVPPSRASDPDWAALSYQVQPTPPEQRRLEPARALAKSLTWSQPPCRFADAVSLEVLVARETVRLPLDGTPFPDSCGSAEQGREGTIQAAMWSRLDEDSACAMSEWGSEARIEPFHVLKHEGTGAELRHIAITVDLQNEAGRPCDIDVKPLFYIVANGRRLSTSHFMTSEGRVGPPLPPSGRARAELFWDSYCGPRLDDYEIYVEIPGRPGAVSMITTGGKPVPECHRNPDDPDSVGQTSSGWIEPVPARR